MAGSGDKKKVKIAQDSYFAYLKENGYEYKVIRE